jgi:ubiquinone/menaquinone biosynthesis C-methylase UbiE
MQDEGLWSVPMERSITGVAETLQSAYDEQYTDAVTEWREVGGKYKAENILNLCKNQRFAKVLECGAGEGSILKFLDAADVFQELYAIEISASGVSQILKRNLRKVKDVKKFNGYEIPYSDKEFDMAFCSHVLEHVEHPRILLRELKRVSNYQVFEVPLDYSSSVDQKVGHCLSYGHINIYTPSLFKFLIKSEGYEIVAELLTHTPMEVIRYGKYKNNGLKRTYYRDLTLEFEHFLHVLKMKLYGKKRFKEYGYSAYTCLARGVGNLKIF